MSNANFADVVKTCVLVLAPSVQLIASTVNGRRGRTVAVDVVKAVEGALEVSAFRLCMAEEDAGNSWKRNTANRRTYFVSDRMDEIVVSIHFGNATLQIVVLKLMIRLFIWVDTSSSFTVCYFE